MFTPLFDWCGRKADQRSVSGADALFYHGSEWDAQASVGDQRGVFGADALFYHGSERDARTSVGPFKKINNLNSDLTT